MNNENNGINPTDPMMPNTNPGMTPTPEAPAAPVEPVAPVTPVDATPVVSAAPEAAPMPGPAPMDQNPNMGMNPQMATPTPEPAPAPMPNMGPTPNMGMNPQMQPTPNMGMGQLPEEPKKKNNTMFIIIIAALVVVIVVVLVLVLGKGKSNTPTPTPDTTNTGNNTNPGGNTPVATTDEYNVSGFKFTIPAGWSGVMDGDYLQLRNDANTAVIRFTIGRYENYSDYVTNSDQLKTLLEEQGVTVTNVSETFAGLKTWLVLQGTIQDKFVEFALTDYKNSVAVALIMSTSNNMADNYSVLSNMLDTAVEDTSSFAPGEPQGIKPDLSGLSL